MIVFFGIILSRKLNEVHEENIINDRQINYLIFH